MDQLREFQCDGRIVDWLWGLSKFRIEDEIHIQGNICPVLFFTLSPELSSDKFKTGQIPIFPIISLQTQLCLGEFKTGQNCLQVLKGENNTGQNNPVYRSN